MCQLTAILLRTATQQTRPMTAIPALQPPKALLHAQTSQTDDAATMSSLAPPFAAFWRQLNSDARHEMAAKTDKLKGMAAGNSGAMSLHLAQLATQRQRTIAAFNVQASKVIAQVSPNAGDLQVIDTFEKIMTEENEGTVKNNSDVLGKYTNYMGEISALMVRINATVTPDADGKSNLNGKQILQAIETFCKKWSGSQGVIRSFATEGEATAYMERFRGSTTRVQWSAEKKTFDVRFAPVALSPICEALCTTAADGEAFKTALKQGGAGITQLAWRLRPDKANSAIVQSLSLATSDVQKTYQTDLDLQISELSRAISQFDNLVKLFSSMVAALTDTYKSFL